MQRKNPTPYVQILPMTKTAIAKRIKKTLEENPERFENNSDGQLPQILESNIDQNILTFMLANLMNLQNLALAPDAAEKIADCTSSLTCPINVDYHLTHTRDEIIDAMQERAKEGEIADLSFEQFKQISELFHVMDDLARLEKEIIPGCCPPMMPAFTDEKLIALLTHLLPNDETYLQQLNKKLEEICPVVNSLYGLKGGRSGLLASLQRAIWNKTNEQFHLAEVDFIILSQLEELACANTNITSNLKEEFDTIADHYLRYNLNQFQQACKEYQDDVSSRIEKILKEQEPDLYNYYYHFAAMFTGEKRILVEKPFQKQDGTTGVITDVYNDVVPLYRHQDPVSKMIEHAYAETSLPKAKTTDENEIVNDFCASSQSNNLLDAKQELKAFCRRNSEFSTLIERAVATKELMKKTEAKGPTLTVFTKVNQLYKSDGIQSRLEESFAKKLGKILLTALTCGLLYNYLWNTPRHHFKGTCTTLFSHAHKIKDFGNAHIDKKPSQHR